MRLKNKLGDHSNASSEVEYTNAVGNMIGDAGKGVKTILDMVVHTRLDCTIGSAALMRHCAQNAAFHTMHRSAFGSPLIHQPLMRSVLADLGIETEAAVSNWIRLAQAFDRANEGDEEEGEISIADTTIGYSLSM